MELVTGQLVISRQGRDATKVYMITGFEAGCLLLTDGGKWPLAAPKRKNIRHIMPTTTIVANGQAESDQTIKAALAKFETGKEPDIKEDRKLV